MANSKPMRIQDRNWNNHKGEAFRVTIDLDPDNGKDIAIVYDGATNARLIANAPTMRDLLTEALMYVEECEQFHKPGCRTLSKRIKAAIAKAEGRGEN